MNLETAQRLYEYRKNSGLSQEELADKIGVSRQAVSKWERSEASPDTDNLIALSKIYNVTIDELINGKTNTDEIKHKGIHIESKDGNVVDIGINGVHITENGAEKSAEDKVIINGETIEKKVENSLFSAIMASITLTLALAFYLYCGFTDTVGGWAYSWVVFFLVPIIHSICDVIKKKDPSCLGIPFISVFVYLVFGLYCDIWHPTWVVFLIIPIYYIIVDAFKKSKKGAK